MKAAQLSTNKDIVNNLVVKKNGYFYSATVTVHVTNVADYLMVKL